MDNYPTDVTTCSGGTMTSCWVDEDGSYFPKNSLCPNKRYNSCAYFTYRSIDGGNFKCLPSIYCGKGIAESLTHGPDALEVSGIIDCQDGIKGECPPR